MRKDLVDSVNWRNLRNHRTPGPNQFGSSPRARLTAHLTVDAVDAAFEEVTLGQAATGGSSKTGETSETCEASEFVHSLEIQLVHLEAQCQQLRKLLDGAKA